MTRRTIDETGKDISERRPELELVQAGWYWTGTHVVRVVGPTLNGRGVQYQTEASGCWALMREAANWQRVHERVKKSGQGFGWSPPVPND